MSRQVHDAVNKARLLTKAEFDEMGWTYLEPGVPHYLVTKDETRIFPFLSVSSKMIFDLDEGILEGKEGLKAMQ
jgi:hypothetical protein